MSTLERRLQVLLSADLHERLETEARRCGCSVGAVVREAVELRLDGHAATRRAAAQRLLARAARADAPAEEDWPRIKAGLESGLAERFA